MTDIYHILALWTGSKLEGSIVMDLFKVQKNWNNIKVCTFEYFSIEEILS